MSSHVDLCIIKGQHGILLCTGQNGIRTINGVNMGHPILTPGSIWDMSQHGMQHIYIIGHNTLKVYIKRMFNLPGIDTTRFITNHSGKVTLCTTLFNDGFDDQMVGQRSGHRSTSVDSYKRPGDSLLHSISNRLQPPKPKYSSSTITKKQ